MGNPEVLPDLDQLGNAKIQKLNVDNEDHLSKHPGSKAQGRKRTKTGCLSELVTISSMSMSRKTALTPVL
jgi:hypothetical protein